MAFLERSQSSPRRFLVHSQSIPTAFPQHSQKVPTAFPQHSQEVPGAFLECSRSFLGAFPEPSRSSDSPSCPHQDGGVLHLLPLSLTSCCHLGFSQRWNEAFVHVHMCVRPFVSPSPPPLSSLLPLLPPSHPLPRQLPQHQSWDALSHPPPVYRHQSFPVNAPRSGILTRVCARATIPSLRTRVS